MTSVLPLRPSINWKRIGHESPFGPCSSSLPVCDTFRHILRVDRNLNLGLFVDSTEDVVAHQSSARGTICLPGTWSPKKPMRCSSKDMPPRTRIEKVATPNATCLRLLGVSRLPPDPSEATNKLLLTHSLKPLLSHILASLHSAHSFASNQPRANKPRANKTWSVSQNSWANVTR